MMMMMMMQIVKKFLVTVILQVNIGVQRNALQPKIQKTKGNFPGIM